MRAFVLTTLAFVCALLMAPLATAQTVGAPLQLRTGDAFTVSMEYTQTSVMGGEDFDARMTQVYTVHVVDAEARVWRFVPVSFGYEFPEMPGLDAAAAAVNWPAISDAISAFMRVATDIGFECRVDAYGRCEEILNWDVWEARVENLVLMGDAIARAVPTSTPAADAPTITPTPPQERPRRDSKQNDSEGGMTHAPTPSWETLRVPVLQGISRLLDGFDGRDAAAGMASLYYPAFVQGRVLTRRETVSVTDEYELPFGAPPLRYVGTMQLERINRRDNTGVVVRRVSLDQASARSSLRAMTEFVTDAVVTPLRPHFQGEDVPDGAGVANLVDTMLADLAYEETTRGVIDLATGMARETTTDFTLSARMVSTEDAVTTRGRVVTRVTMGAPAPTRLPRG